MALSIVDAVATIKRSVAQCLTVESIHQACRQVGHTWRERELGPAQTMWAFLLQVLYGNTACAHVVRLARLSCSAAAYCSARARLPLAVYERILQQTSQAARQSFREPRWCGHRTFYVDGTGFSMPDTKQLREHFGQPSTQRAGCGFPVAHLLAMFDAATGLLVKMVATPLRTHDLVQVADFHPELRPGDVLVGDTAFACYVHLALLLRAKLHGVFRAHQRTLVSFRRDRKLVGRRPKGTTATGANSRLVRKLGRYDQIVEYRKPPQCPRWMTADEYTMLPETLQVRELRYWTCQRGFRTRVVTLVTTLLNAELYPLEEMAALYGRRWEVETNFAHLKTTMQMDVLHCQTVQGVLKELIMFALVYNLARLVMLAAAREQHVSPQRLSFVDALRWLAAACEHRSQLELRINPHRPGRYEPRVKKRRTKNYRLMRQPRCQLRQQLATQKLTA
jgi:Transposase DDE domain